VCTRAALIRLQHGRELCHSAAPDTSLHARLFLTSASTLTMNASNSPTSESAPPGPSQMLDAAVIGTTTAPGGVRELHHKGPIGRERWLGRWPQLTPAMPRRDMALSRCPLHDKVVLCLKEYRISWRSWTWRKCSIAGAEARPKCSIFFSSRFNQSDRRRHGTGTPPHLWAVRAGAHLAGVAWPCKERRPPAWRFLARGWPLMTWDQRCCAPLARLAGRGVRPGGAAQGRAPGPGRGRDADGTTELW